MGFDRRVEKEIKFGLMRSPEAKLWQERLYQGEFEQDGQRYVIVDHDWEDRGLEGVVLHVTYLKPRPIISQHARP